VQYEKLSDDRLGEPSTAIRARVEAARERQRQRFAGTGLMANGDMGPAEVRDHCRVDDVPAHGRDGQDPAAGGDAAAPREYAHERPGVRRAPQELTASSNWRGRLRTWRGARGSRRRTWLRRFSIG